MFSESQPACELAGAFSVFTSALFDAALVVGMLTAPPAGQNAHRVASVSIKGIFKKLYKLGKFVG